MNTNEKLKEQLGDSLCEYCPWHNGEIDHAPGMTCEGLYCDDALDVFLDDNEQYFDDEGYAGSSLEWNQQ